MASIEIELVELLKIARVNGFTITDDFTATVVGHYVLGYVSGGRYTQTMILAQNAVSWLNYINNNNKIYGEPYLTSNNKIVVFKSA